MPDRGDPADPRVILTQLGFRQEASTLSFFDEDDEPRRRTRRPRRATGGAAVTDSQTVLVRRLVAGALALLVLVLLAVAVNSCLNSRQENALKDYTREVSSIATESERQVGQEFFNTLRQRGSESPQDLQTAISGFRAQAETQLNQAEDLDVPDEMEPAQRSLLIALQFRRDGLGYIAERIQPALGDQADQAEEAVTQIAGQMEGFLASDVVYSARVMPLIRGVLDDNEVDGQQIARSQFLPGIQWIVPANVGEALGQQVTGGGDTGAANEREPAPGLHGTGLDAVSVGDTALEPSPAPNRLPASEDTTFSVRFTNQGENDETDVKVDLAIEPENGQPIRVSRTIDTVRAGAEATAEIPLGTRPPLGAATVRVLVNRVPGEEKGDNNRGEYDVGFVAP